MDDEVLKLFDRRKKIIKHNNYAVLETIIFCEIFFLDQIIIPYFLNENYENCKSFKKYVLGRMTFDDRYKIIKDLAKQYKIDGALNQKEFETYIEARNDIAHNLSGVGGYNSSTDEHQIFIGGKGVEWDQYLTNLKRWSEISLQGAAFNRKLYEKINLPSKSSLIPFCYCKLEENCVLVQHNLVSPEPVDEYVCFTHGGMDSELIQMIVEENDFRRTN